MDPHITRLDESPEYRKARSEVRLAEADLVRQREEVAALRRALPGSTEIPDYELDAGAKPVQLSELFTGEDRSLIVYHFMFGKAHETPCPMCTLWTDGFNGVAPQVTQRADFAVVAAAPAEHFRRFGARRGWTNLRLFGGGASTFKYDLGSEDAAGNQSPAISVLRLGADGRVHHFYTGRAHLLETLHRGLDLLSPVWHLLDLTPEGRGDWMPQSPALGSPEDGSHHFQPDPGTITWRMRFKSEPRTVYQALTTDSGRRAFWAEDTREQSGTIDFEFPGGVNGTSRILAAEPDRLWRIDYFGAIVTFELDRTDTGGTDLTLVTRGFAPDDRDELLAGWLNVLFPLKAYVDHGVDLRNHDPDRTWWHGYADQ